MATDLGDDLWHAECWPQISREDAEKLDSDGWDLTPTGEQGDELPPERPGP